MAEITKVRISDTGIEYSTSRETAESVLQSSFVYSTRISFVFLLYTAKTDIIVSNNTQKGADAMFDRIFANYLVESGKLTEQNLKTIFSSQEEKRVRLGVIAVSEKLMTIEQVEEVNKLQSMCDKRFGDIAVEKGYLTDEQINRLLQLQGNALLALIQSTVDGGYMSMEMIDEALLSFQKENNYTLMNMEDLKSGDIDRIVPIYVYEQPELLQELCGVMVRSVNRLVDYHISIKKPYCITNYSFDQFCMQELRGAHSIFTTLSGSASTMKHAAIGFAGERYIENDEDALDALSEFINCVNGLFATELSKRDISVDMEIPYYQTTPGEINADVLLCLPIIISGNEMNLVAALDQTYTLKKE